MGVWGLRPQRVQGRALAFLLTYLTPLGTGRPDDTVWTKAGTGAKHPGLWRTDIDATVLEFTAMPVTRLEARFHPTQAR
jgi:hypothetical protein